MSSARVPVLATLKMPVRVYILEVFMLFFDSLGVDPSTFFWIPAINLDNYWKSISGPIFGEVARRMSAKFHKATAVSAVFSRLSLRVSLYTKYNESFYQL